MMAFACPENMYGQLPGEELEGLHDHAHQDRGGGSQPIHRVELKLRKVTGSEIKILESDGDPKN